MTYIIYKDWLTKNLMLDCDVINIIRYNLYLLPNKRRVLAPPINLILDALNHQQNQVVYNDIIFDLQGRFDSNSVAGRPLRDVYYQRESEIYFRYTTPTYDINKGYALVSRLNKIDKVKEKIKYKFYLKNEQVN